MKYHLPVAQVPGLYRRDLGAFRIATVHDGMLDAAFDDLAGADPAEWKRAHRAAFRSLPPRLACNTFVVETPDRLWLVDAGCGNTAAQAGLQRAGLAALGIAPDDVGGLLMTHLHRDHAAGLIDEAGRAVFPNAALVVHRDDLAFWTDPSSVDRLRESQKQDAAIATTVLRAYADRIRPVGGGEVAPGIVAVPTPGHTPGHTAWLLQSGADQLMIWGDIVHLPVIQFGNPDASVVYDLDSTAAAAARKQVLAMAAAERLPVAGVHLDFPCFGHVEAHAGGGFTYTPEIWTSNV